jgi:hypothetical protein
MALGALVGAYVEDDSGGLRALLPLAGRTLIEYQVRCAAAAGAAPVLVLVERVPQALQDAFERLRVEGIGVFPVSDAHEAVSRFEAGSTILVIGDGIAPPAALVAQLAEDADATVATVPDDEAHAMFERIDDRSRWAGLAVIEGELLASTARMLGDWDLQSTLLRRAIQEGAVRVPVSEGMVPVLAEESGQLAEFQRGLLAGSRVERDDAASRYILPPVEDWATEQLLDSQVRPEWLLWTAFGLTLAAVIALMSGLIGVGIGLLIVSTPLDLVAARLATIRLRPLPARYWARRALWPLSGLALLALAWWEWGHVSGWGAMVTALSAAAFAQAAMLERYSSPGDWDLWLFSRRNAILLALPFALLSAWTTYLLALLAYSAASFFLVQKLRRKLGPVPG